MTEGTQDGAASSAAKTDPAASAATNAGQAAAVKQKPSMGRIVIFRDGVGNLAPAIITRIYDTGAVALHVFRDDAAANYSYGGQNEVAADGTDIGWFWPPRV